ncbi:MAG: GNAT family N-acetyltransferase [Candidatus Heimdallarchaeota archaeon]|nr:GNAT family N-acetyltransferase [Candidatus Heimdallarchaeota archaeon]
MIRYWLKSKPLSREDKKEYVNNLKFKLKQEDYIGFVALIKNNPKGFLLCYIDQTHIEGQQLLFKKIKKEDEVIKGLLEKAGKYTNELKKQMFQTFYVENLNLKNDLINKGFNVYQRARMSFEIPEDINYQIELENCYKLSKISHYRIKDIFQVIVKANKEHIDGEIFIQFSDFELLNRFAKRSLGDLECIDAESPIILYGDEIVGVNIITLLPENCAYVWDISVSPEHQRKGLGTALMYKLVEECKLKGIQRILLDVTIDNSKAFGLYSKLGYKDDKRYLTVTKRF